MSKSLYLIVQETITDSKMKIITPLGIHDSFKGSIYQCIRFNMLDKIEELESGDYSTLFNIYIQEMILNENYLGDTYILLDKRKSDYINAEELKLYIENSKTGKIEEVDDNDNKAFRKVCKNSGIIKIIKKYNKSVEDFLKNSENIEKLKHKKEQEQEQELHRKYEADIKAYIKMKQDKIPIPLPEFNRLSRRELEGLSFSQYKKIRKKASNEFQDLKMYKLPVPKQSSGHGVLNPEERGFAETLPRRRRRVR